MQYYVQYESTSERKNNTSIASRRGWRIIQVMGSWLIASDGLSSSWQQKLNLESIIWPTMLVLCSGRDQIQWWAYLRFQCDNDASDIDVTFVAICHTSRWYPKKDRSWIPTITLEHSKLQTPSKCVNEFAMALIKEPDLSFVCSQKQPFVVRMSYEFIKTDHDAVLVQLNGLPYFHPFNETALRH